MEEQPKDNTGKVLGGVGITAGVAIGIVVCCVLVACATILILALLGPAIGNVFSNIVIEI